MTSVERDMNHVLKPRVAMTSFLDLSPALSRTQASLCSDGFRGRALMSLNTQAHTSLLPTEFYDAYLFDLDGTIYLGSELLPGAKHLIETLRARGSKTVFLSNNPTRDPEMYIKKLSGLGIPVTAGEIINTVVSIAPRAKSSQCSGVSYC
jgi:hypothetical protein